MKRRLYKGKEPKDNVDIKNVVKRPALYDEPGRICNPNEPGKSRERRDVLSPITIRKSCSNNPYWRDIFVPAVVRHAGARKNISFVVSKRNSRRRYLSPRTKRVIRLGACVNFTHAPRRITLEGFASFSSPEPQRFCLNCWTRGSGTIQKYLFFHWLSKTLCAIRLKMLRFCALAFTSGETLEIVLYKGRNNVNIFVDR